MPVTSPPVQRVPDFWRIFGHSFFQHTFGTRTQAGRADSAVRSLFDIEFNNWFNHSQNGAKLMNEGLPQGGWARVLQNITGSPSVNAVEPWVAQGGCTLFCYGINDLGHAGDDAQYRTAFEYALRMVISRARMSSLREDNTTASASQGSIVYGAGWTQLAFAWDFASGQTIRQCVTTTAATITITIPAGYDGSAICLMFACNPGVLGGTITFSGTAGITGTHVVSNIQPGAQAQRSPRPKRITTLTSANAGQTIICTTTQIDASGVLYFDGYWVEAVAPPPVLVCDITKLTSVGYDVYPALASNSDSVNHAAVDVWNGVIRSVVAEFDSMVQVVETDAAIDTVGGLAAHAVYPTMSFDGLHPSEFGAARIAGAVADAVQRLRPTSPLGAPAHLNPPSARSSALTQPYRDGSWYTTETTGGNSGTAYTCVSGDMWAIPFFISQGTMQITQWSVEKVTSTVATTVFMAIYDDRQLRGYPQYQHVTPANTTALTLVGSPGIFTSVTSPGNGYILHPIDPGLYWIVIKIVTAGTTTLRTLAGQSRWMPNLSTSGGGNVLFNGYKLTGQGTGVMPGYFMTGGVASNFAPYIGLKMQNIGEI